jgi:hypothetical protein
MAVIRRKKENIDLLERAMMGVHTGGLLGTRSKVKFNVRDLHSEERVVVVRMHDAPQGGRRRKSKSS